jgi:uncharacterized membrane protein YecN with MAPEG domain
MILPVTLVIAAACGLLNLWLALRVSQRRMAKQVMIGDGGDSLMVSRGRAHANFTEYAPFVLVLMALVELARGDTPWLWGLGAAFVLARLAHPIGMDRPAPNPFRAGGIAVTWLVLAGLAGWAVVIAWQAERAPVPADAIEVAPASA